MSAFATQGGHKNRTTFKYFDVFLFFGTQPGLLLSFLSWAYVLQGVYFWEYGTPGVSIFGVFVRQAFPFSA